MEYYIINEKDNVGVCLSDGHKYAIKDIKCSERVIKYGFPIGIAKTDIKKGEKVHTNNLKTALEGKLEYEYTPDFKYTHIPCDTYINAYVRKNGEVGIRNDIWIITTVGCVNGIAKTVSEKTGALCFTHPYGCSQLGEDSEITQKTLRGLVKHPNAGGVLVLGLGCENNSISEFKKVLGEYDSNRIRFLNCSECENEIETAVNTVHELEEIAKKDVRESVSFSRLKIGLKCGGSDGLSGITANPLCGRFTDYFVSVGGIAVLTEVPEMFGAEQILMNRCVNKDVFDKTVKLINGYKDYFISHSQPISENPSPGNKEGGITTLEEKSLGCVQKGGTSPVSAVLDYGDTAKIAGLNLLNGPGNDIVAVTQLTAAGCHLILFTTGRGTPLGAPVPTVKIATNTELFNRKKTWTDFDAQTGNESELKKLVEDTANGKPTKNELNGFREIAIFKNGVTL